MPGGLSGLGLGTSGQNFNAGGNTNQFSQTNPYGPAQTGINTSLQAAQQIAGGDNSVFSNNPQQNFGFENAYNMVGAMPNFGPAAAQTGANFLQTGGDPTGILRRESQDIGYGDPQNTPGMKGVLDTIKNDISNQVNGQFAGAGRSLSGLNQQTLARGMSQGMAVPLLNQYNQNIANQMGIQGAATGNIGQGLQYGAMAPGLAAAPGMLQNQIATQRRMQPYQLLAQYENLINPIAGLGGSVTGGQQSNQSGSGTATNSPLSQLGQIGGLINPFGGLLGTLFG